MQFGDTKRPLRARPWRYRACKIIKFDVFQVAMVEVRGFPNGIFNPWARWISGLTLARNSSAVVAIAVVVALQEYTENAKT